MKKDLIKLIIIFLIIVIFPIVGRASYMPFSNGGIGGNLGLGTTSPQGSLTITNGNMGIATWAPTGYLQINKPSAAPFIVTTAGNVGVGTITPQAAFVVSNGNVGIGTWAAGGGYLIINSGGNVGIGSAWPGMVLDVNGTVRATGFTTLTGVAAGWTNSGGKTYVTSGSDNVGIGTSTPQGALTISNGNVGIATWAPTGLLQINKPSASPFIVTSTGNVGIGTITPQTAFAVTNGNVGIGTWNAFGGALIIPSGLVGIGSTTPNGALDVTTTMSATSGTLNNLYDFTLVVPGSTSSAIYNGVNSTMYFSGDGTGGASLRGVNGITAIIGGDIASNYGLLFYAQNGGTGTVTSNYGAFAASVNASSGTITNSIAVYGPASNESTGNVTNGYGVIGAYSNSGAGTTTQAFGGNFSVAQSAGAITTAYGVYIGSTQGTNKWSLYSADSAAPNFFAANVGINSLSPGTKLDVMSVDNGTAMRVLIPATSANVTGSDTFISFNSSSGQIGNVIGTAGSGVIAFNTFTGSHWTQIEDAKDLFDSALLCSTGEVVDWDQHQLTKTRICRKEADPSVLGVFGGFDNEGKAMALSIGTGYMLVANKGEDLAVGDYLTSSDLLGLAQKQGDNIYRNYTAGKIMQNIRWKPGEKSRKVAVIYEGG